MAININFVDANVMNILQSFSFMPLMASDFLIFLCKFILSVAMATNQIRLDKIYMFGRGLLKEHFRNLCQNICSDTEIRAYFHFSHYKSMEIISCHSDEST